MLQDRPGSSADGSVSRLRGPAVVGSLVLVIMVLGASAGAYALTRTSSPKDGSGVQVSSTPQPAGVPMDTQLGP